MDRTYFMRHVEKYLGRFVAKFTPATRDILAFIDEDDDFQDDLGFMLEPLQNNNVSDELSEYLRRQSKTNSRLSKYTKYYSSRIEECLNESKFKIQDVQGGYFYRYLVFYQKLTEKIVYIRERIEANLNQNLENRLILAERLQSTIQYLLMASKLFADHFFNAFF
jgi:hypothetical protein